MWPLVAAAGVSGVASMFGQRSANQQNVKLAREGMAFEADQVSKQMQFQERMSGTAYQRATEDMRLAGINPMVAYQQGGASTPGGGAASGAAATVQDVVGPAVASAQHARRLHQELVGMKAQARGATAIADREEATNAALGFRRSPTGGIHFDMSMPNLTDRIRAETSSAQSAARLAEYSVPQARQSANIYEGRYSGPVAAWMDRIFRGGALAPIGLRR